MTHLYCTYVFIENIYIYKVQISIHIYFRIFQKQELIETAGEYGGFKSSITFDAEAFAKDSVLMYNLIGRPVTKNSTIVGLELVPLSYFISSDFIGMVNIIIAFYKEIVTLISIFSNHFCNTMITRCSTTHSRYHLLIKLANFRTILLVLVLFIENVLNFFSKYWRTVKVSCLTLVLNQSIYKLFKRIWLLPLVTIRDLTTCAQSKVIS